MSRFSRALRVSCLAAMVGAIGVAQAAPKSKAAVRGDEPLPRVAPEKAGFSSKALGRIDAFFEREIAAGRIPGAVLAVARDGKLVYYKAHGYVDKAAGTPMPRDAIFALASMTKVMAAVAALKLNEEGKLLLKSRLDSYFPEFADMKVGVPQAASGELALEPQKQPIYIQDLFRHTSGLTYGGRGDHPVAKFYPVGTIATDIDGAEFIKRITKLPLAHQPGTAFEYGFSIDVLGLVVEKISGKRLGEYLAENVWGPAGMTETGFAVPADKRARLAKPLANDPISGKPQRIPLHEAVGKFDCGGACAFGTVRDYLRFGQMLLNGGELDGKRVLSPATVRAMTSNHLPPSIKNNVAVIEPHRDGYGFGLGVAVRMDDGLAAVPGTKGDYTWNGAYGTAFWADPKEKLVVVLGTAGPGDIRKYNREQVGALVYGAMTRLK